MLEIERIEAIKHHLIGKGKKAKEFPESITFPFDKLYVEVVSQIKTTSISSECTLFSQAQAIKDNNDFSNIGYWTDNTSNDELKSFWFFGQNGQGDLWLFDDESKVLFYDHNLEKMCRENFLSLDINFEKWLQFAYLNKQLDRLYDPEYKIYFDKNGLKPEVKMEYKEKLMLLSESLHNNFPFQI